MSQILQSESEKDQAQPKFSTIQCILQFKNGLFQGYANELNHRHGKGVYFWHTGELYYGDWAEDTMEGEGIFYFALGGYIYGTFLNNKVHGYAILYFSDGDYLAGFWEGGMLTGKVIQHSKETDEWTLNEYKNGTPNRVISKGKGNPPLNSFSMMETNHLKKLFNKEISVFREDTTKKDENYKGLEFLPIDPVGWYHGNTRAKRPYGLGIVCYSVDRSDRGRFRKGKMNGPGRSLFANGDVYEGFYKEGKFSETGVYFKGESEQHLYGKFENNECVQPITLAEGYPHELMRNMKAEFVLESAELIDRDTDAEVVRLASQEQTQTQESQETEDYRSDNIVRKQSESQYIEIHKENGQYYEEEDDDIDSEEHGEDEEEEIKGDDQGFLNEMESIGGKVETPKEQAEMKPVEYPQSANKNNRIKSNSLEQNLKESNSKEGRDSSEGYSSVGAKVVESRNVVYFEEEEDEQGKKWSSIPQAVSRQGSSDKMSIKGRSTQSIREYETKENSIEAKKLIGMSEVIEKPPDAEHTMRDSYHSERSEEMSFSRTGYNSGKKEKKDSIFKSYKESVVKVEEIPNSNNNTESDVVMNTQSSWTKEEQRIDKICAKIKTKNEMKAKGMDASGSKGNKDTNGPVKSSSMARETQNVVSNRNSGRLEQEETKQRDGGYQSREGQSAEKAMPRNSLSETNRQSRAINDNSTEKVNTNKVGGSYIRSEVQSILDGLDQDRLNSKRSTSPDFGTSEEPVVRQDPSYRRASNIEDLQYAKPIANNPNIQKAVNQYIQSQTPNIRPININTKTNSGVSSLEASIVQEKMAEPHKVYYGGSFGNVPGNYPDHQSVQKNAYDQQTSRFGQNLDSPISRDFNRQRMASGQFGGNLSSENNPSQESTSSFEKIETYSDKRSSVNPGIPSIPLIAKSGLKEKSPVTQEAQHSPGFANAANRVGAAQRASYTGAGDLYQGGRTAQVTEESARNGNSPRLETGSARIETVSGRMDTGSNESLTGSYTCSERSTGLTTSQILRKYGLDTLQQNPESKPDLLQKLMVPIEENRRASIVYLKRKDPKEKSFQEVATQLMAEKERSPRKLEDELLRIIMLKLEVLVQEQNKMAETVDVLKGALNERIDVLFNGEQKDKEGYKKEFTSKIDLMLMQKTQNMTLDQIVSMHNDLADHSKQVDTSFGGINDKLDMLLQKQGQLKQETINLVNPYEMTKRSYNNYPVEQKSSTAEIQKELMQFKEQERVDPLLQYQMHIRQQEAVSQANPYEIPTRNYTNYSLETQSSNASNIQKAVEEYKEQYRLLNNQLLGSGSKLERASQVTQERQFVNVSTPQKSPGKPFDPNAQRRENMLMKIPNAGSNVLLKGSFQNIEESQNRKSFASYNNVSTEERGRKSTQYEPVDTADYMSLTNESGPPKIVNNILPRSQELSIKNDQTLNLLEYEAQLRKSQNEAAHVRNYSQDIQAVRSPFTPTQKSTVPQRSYTPTPQSRNNLDPVNSGNTPRTPRSPRPIFSHNNSMVADNPAQRYIDDVAGARRSPMASQRETGQFTHERANMSDRRAFRFDNQGANYDNAVRRSPNSQIGYQTVNTPQGPFHPSIREIQMTPRESGSAQRREMMSPGGGHYMHTQKSNTGYSNSGSIRKDVGYVNGPKMMSSSKKSSAQKGYGYQEIELYEDEQGHYVEPRGGMRHVNHVRDTEDMVLHESQSCSQASPLRYRKEPVSPVSPYRGSYQCQEGRMGSVKWRLEVEDSGSDYLGSPFNRETVVKKNINRSNIRDITDYYKEEENAKMMMSRSSHKTQETDGYTKTGGVSPGIREYQDPAKGRGYICAIDELLDEEQRRVYKLSNKAKQNFIVDAKTPTLTLTSELLAKTGQFHYDRVNAPENQARESYRHGEKFFAMK